MTASEDATASKKCTKCGVTKPLDEYGRARKGRLGRKSWCRACESVYQAAWYLANQQKVLEQSRDYYRDNKDVVKRRHQEWERANRESRNARQRAWDVANPGERRRWTAEWRAKNYERALELERAWRDSNREKMREQDKAKRLRNLDKYRERDQRRRARKAGTSATAVDYQALWTGHCSLCGGPMDETLRHPHPMSKSVDHIIPLSRGGAHEQSNCTWAHLWCNLSKGAGDSPRSSPPETNDHHDDANGSENHESQSE